MKASNELEMAKRNESDEGGAPAAGKPLGKVRRSFGAPRSTGHVTRSLGLALLMASGCGTSASDSARDDTASDGAKTQTQVGDEDGAGSTSESGAPLVQAAPPPPNANVAPALLLGCDTSSCCPSGKTIVTYTQNPDVV